MVDAAVQGHQAGHRHRRHASPTTRSPRSPAASTPSADVALRFEVDGLGMPGRGLSTDVVEASARAFLNAMNRIVRVRDSGEDPRSVDRPGSLSQR